ncbi:Syntaxin-binding protein 5 [Oryzias melastigma]|uniref:Syntaxin-binding protein 5 n=1 Tax=Oryzias melastigma TaxID=30732 RepID=A0A834FBR5_ORYME|nr:Syntaxin-binding protein 5 [Oryzias melastigma]
MMQNGFHHSHFPRFGRPGVECYCQHESGAAVIQLQFLINEGALVSALADDSVHLWNLRQKRPAILHSLKFSRERITFCHLPFQSKWLYIGTERGNVHIVNVESFMLSGYVIMWNKAIELSSKAHPGPVVHISDNPMDEGKLLEVRMQSELNETDSPDGGGEPTSAHHTPGASPHTSGPPSQPSTSSNNSDGGNMPCLKVRSTPLKQSAGYQVDLVVQLVWVSGEPPQQITSLALNSSYGLVVFGNSNGVAVVDYIQKTVVLNLGTVELYGSNDPYQRQPRSPRKSRQPSGGLCDINEGSATSEDRCKSPTSVLMSNTNLHQFYNGGGRGAKMSRKLSLPTELKPDLEGFFFLFAGALPLCFLATVLLSVCPPRGANPLDHRDNSFSRSRSSSVTSIDKEAREAISFFHFCETFARKGDSTLTPCLFVGTSLGTVLVLVLTLPPAGEQRQLQPVIISPVGMLVRLKGSVLRMAFLDSSGSLLPPSYDPWYEPNVTTDGEEKVPKRRPVSVSPSTSQELSESQYTVVCSEKQAKVISLPSQTCIYKHNITETSFILRADVVQMSQGVCVACFCANGHIKTLSLPGLRPLMDVNYLPLTDMRIARTFCFTNLGQAMYLCSPTEIQRITYSQETCENLQEMLGELFTPVETPEAPNRGFFKGLFGGGAQSLDREELCMTQNRSKM